VSDKKDKPCPACGVLIAECGCREWDCAFHAHLGKDCPSERGVTYRAKIAAKVAARGAAREVAYGDAISVALGDDLLALIDARVLEWQVSKKMPLLSRGDIIRIALWAQLRHPNRPLPDVPGTGASPKEEP